MNSVPTLVRFVKQSGHHGDCAVVCVAMLGGVLYEDALIACAKVNPHVLQSGLTWPQIRAASKRLGVKVKTLHPADLSESTGILWVSRVALGVSSVDPEHVVFLWDGRIVDGNGELWLDTADYLKHYGYEAKGLLVAREDE